MPQDHRSSPCWGAEEGKEDQNMEKSIYGGLLKMSVWAKCLKDRGTEAPADILMKTDSHEP